ncbi:MAG: alpha/beta fold hydrolase [Acidimicrobiales bacterium]
MLEGPPLRRAGLIFREKPRLIVLCVAVATAEAALLTALGATWAGGLAPQVTAAAPFGLFHDLRWLVVYHQSLPAFVLELAALLIFRSGLDTLIVREAWPIERRGERPGFLKAWLHSLSFTAVAAVLLAPWVMLLFGMAVVSLSWLFFAAVPPVLAVAVLVGPGAVSPNWWRRTVPVRAIGWIALTFLVMTICSGVSGISPGRLSIPVAVLGGLFNAWAWRGVVGAVTSERRSVRFLPVVPASLAGLLIIVVGGAGIGFAVAGARARQARAVAAAQAATVHRPDRGAPVLIASGFGTKWDGTSGPWLPGPFDEVRFSYAGLNAAGRPRAFQASDTVAGLDTLDQEMDAQVDVLAARDHHKVSLVAVSEGSLVAETFLARYPDAPVDQVVLLSPLVTPGRAYYPPAGTDGWGVVARLGLQGLTDTLGSISPFRISPSTALFQSIVDEAPAIRSLLSCPVQGIDQVAVEPVADAVAAPQDPELGIPTVVVPAFHSGALGDAGADAVVIDVLEHKVLPANAGWAILEHVLRPASAAWQVPPLALNANPAWKLGPDAVIEPNGDMSCTSARALAGG